MEQYGNGCGGLRLFRFGDEGRGNYGHSANAQPGLGTVSTQCGRFSTNCPDCH